MAKEKNDKKEEKVKAPAKEKTVTKSKEKTAQKEKTVKSSKSPKKKEVVAVVPDKEEKVIHDSPVVNKNSEDHLEEVKVEEQKTETKNSSFFSNLVDKVKKESSDFVTYVKSDEFKEKVSETKTTILEKKDNFQKGMKDFDKKHKKTFDSIFFKLTGKKDKSSKEGSKPSENDESKK